jgi:hypothetical protein
MPAGKWKVFDQAKLDIANADIDLDNHSFKIALFSSASNCNDLTQLTLAGLTNQLATAFGYTQNSKAVTITTSKVGGTVTVDETTNPQWTATGGSITARYAVIYDDTHPSKRPLCVSVLDTTPADVTATDGNTFTINQNASGLFSIAGAIID